MTVILLTYRLDSMSFVVDKLNNMDSRTLYNTLWASLLHSLEDATPEKHNEIMLALGPDDDISEQVLCEVISHDLFMLNRLYLILIRATVPAP